MVSHKRIYLLLFLSGIALFFIQCASLQPVSSSRSSAGVNPSRLEPLVPRGREEKVVSGQTKTKESTHSSEDFEEVESPPSESFPSPPTKKREEESPGRADVRSDLIHFARKYKGTPYKYGGKDPRGFDCSGFTQFVYKNYEIPLPGNSGMQAGIGQRYASVKAAKPGDLLFFSKEPNGKGGINHVGLIVKITARELVIIHSTSRGVVEENIALSPYWSPRVLYAGDVLSR
jgi:cell wall-associated NlpC family hydrolase